MFTKARQRWFSAVGPLVSKTLVNILLVTKTMIVKILVAMMTNVNETIGGKIISSMKIGSKIISSKIIGKKIIGIARTVVEQKLVAKTLVANIFVFNINHPLQPIINKNISSQTFKNKPIDSRNIVSITINSKGISYYKILTKFFPFFGSQFFCRYQIETLKNTTKVLRSHVLINFLTQFDIYLKTVMINIRLNATKKDSLHYPSESSFFTATSSFIILVTSKKKLSSTRSITCTSLRIAITLRETTMHHETGISVSPNGAVHSSCYGTQGKSENNLPWI